MSYLDRIAACKRWDPQAYRPFMIEDAVLGRVRHGFARRLAEFPEAFVVSDRALALAPGLGDFEARSRAVRAVLLELKAQGEIPRWREEDYPVLRCWGDRALMKMERAAVPLFGVRGFGVHLNGLVRGTGGLRLWVAKRAADKQTAPGKLDHIVAGGQPYGLGVRENLIKEAREEAGIPPALAAEAVPVGAVSYRCERPEGLRDDVLFCYDLELPEDFAPVNEDGEVESFSLWPMDEVLARIRETDDFKFNVNLVVLDLAVRRGLIAPDDPDYQEIWEGLRLREPG
jgi:8-oxo-dGTP pyrophosphatase MutT (NUDIX family)